MLRYIVLHSDDRESKDSVAQDLETSQIELRFSNSKFTGKYNRLGAVGCRTFTMPNTLYNVSDFIHPRKGQMNKIVVTNGVFTFTGVVPKGYYTLSNLLTSLNAGGTTVWTGYGAGDAMVFTQDAVTGLVSATIGGGGVNNGASFYFPNTLTSTPTLTGFAGQVVTGRSWVAHLLGFHNYNATTRTTQVAIRQPNMLPMQHLYLALVDMKTAILPGSESSQASGSALACIPLSAPYGEQIIYQNDHPVMFETEAEKTSAMGLLTFALVDDTGVVIQNNSAKWEATLEGEFIPSVEHGGGTQRPGAGVDGGVLQRIPRLPNHLRL